MEPSNRVPDPSPVEIRERCEAIQSTWTATEERSRRQGVPTEPVAYQVQVVPTRIGGREIPRE